MSVPVFLTPEFIADLQSHGDANFARRVLKKTLRPDGSFRSDADDHRYEGIEDAWIRYVSRGRTSYRVIYFRLGKKIYLYRAGEHDIEKRLANLRKANVASALHVHESGDEIQAVLEMEYMTDAKRTRIKVPANRFRRNAPCPQIYQEIFSRRNLPHKDIWLVSPFISGDLFLPTAVFGKFLLDQIEDDAKVVIVTSPPGKKSIDWMEGLAERGVEIFVYPHLHTKLYCFIFDQNRRHDPSLRGCGQCSSLILLGSANLTGAGIVSDSGSGNEELCYMVPEENMSYIEGYIIELMNHGYPLSDVRRYLATGQHQQLEKRKW